MRPRVAIAPLRLPIVLACLFYFFTAEAQQNGGQQNGQQQNQSQQHGQQQSESQREILQEYRPQQDSLFRFLGSYPGAVSDMTVDKLGNLYLLYPGGQLKKLRSDGDSLGVFNNIRRFGKLFSIDVSNPLKTLLFYKNFGTIVVLDRLMNVRTTIDLRKQQLLRVGAIGQSYDNNIWIFDEIELRLKKIGDDGRPIDQSPDFRQLFDSVPSPHQIIDQTNLVYLYDPRMGVYQFDYYGAFKGRLPFRGWRDFNVINNTLVGRDADFLYRYDAGSLELQQYKLPPFMKDAKKIIILSGQLYLLKDEGVLVYSYL